MGYPDAVSKVWLGVALGLALCSCEADDEHEQGRRTFCHGFCDGLRSCVLADSSCDENCLDSYHPSGLRGSALSAIGACLSHAFCYDLETDEAFKICADQAAEQTPLRPALLSYCESASLNYFRCNGFWPVEECTATMGLWDDDRLRDAQACHDAACNALRSCEGAVFTSP